jgi:phosphate transport system permease protein
MSDTNTTSTLPKEPPRFLLESTVSTGRRVRDRVATMWMLASVLVALIPLVFVFGYTIQKGIGIIDKAWFTEDPPIVSMLRGGGMKAAIVGTVVITAWAAAMAVPLGVLAAVYLNEFGGTGRLAGVIRFMADVMTGVPSVVMGLFIYVTWVLRYGLSGFAGALAIGALMLPIVIRSSEEMLKLVPDDLRQASDALGARKWYTALRVTLPAALPGIVSGVMLAIARAAGETAPLVFTIGAARATNPNAFDGPNTALPMQIFRNAQTTFPSAIDRAWGSALTLIAIVFVCTVVARVVSARFSTLPR